MQISSTINHVNENNYDVDINVTNIPSGHFVGVISNVAPPSGDDTRQIGLLIMPLEQSPGGNVNVNSGIIKKQGDEKKIKISLEHNGQEVATGTCSY